MSIKMRAILPKPFKVDAFEREFMVAVKQTIEVADKEFAKTYKTWNHKPEFAKTVKATLGQVIGEIITLDQIYSWLNYGTEGPYPIPKTGRKLLAFPSGYTAKTVPNTLYSKSGGSSGPTAFAMKVMHPGIKPRAWDKLVKKFVEPWFKYYGDAAMKRAAKASGHGI